MRIAMNAARKVAVIRAAALAFGLCTAAIGAEGKEMNVTMKVIPHSAQRYETVGDWRFTKRGDLRITVSKMSDPRYETLVAVHELIEAVMCRQAGVSQAAVDAFDMAYEKTRSPGDDSEPGDDRRAPYHQQHIIATWFERQLASQLGVDWAKYNAEVESK